MNKTYKRFIAGAICPICKKQDTVVMRKFEDSEIIVECIQCQSQIKQENTTKNKTIDERSITISQID